VKEGPRGRGPSRSRAPRTDARSNCETVARTDKSAWVGAKSPKSLEKRAAWACVVGSLEERLDTRGPLKPEAVGGVRARLDAPRERGVIGLRIVSARDRESAAAVY
jgi:hypothetical protein